MSIRINTEPPTTLSIHCGVASFYSGLLAEHLTVENCGIYHDSVGKDQFELFKIMIHWMNTREEFTSDNFDVADAPAMWLLARRYEIPLLQNQMINFMVQTELNSLYDWDLYEAELSKEDARDAFRETPFPLSKTAFVYENTDEKSKLRRFFIFMMIHGFVGVRMIWEACDPMTEWPKLALWDLVQQLYIEHRAYEFDYWDNPLEDEDLCTYHVHGEGERCREDSKPTRKYPV